MAIWPLIDERSCRREASCDSIRCFCAAFCATIVCCSEWAFRSSSRLRWIAALKDVTCWTMLASWREVELTASILLSRSSRLDAPSSTESVELSWVDVYALTSRAASESCATFRFLRVSFSCVRFSRWSVSIFWRRTFARLYDSTAAPRLSSICWIWARTCCACACFDATVPGVALADAAAHSAAMQRKNACACRFLPQVASTRNIRVDGRTGGGRYVTSGAP